MTTPLATGAGSSSPAPARRIAPWYSHSEDWRRGYRRGAAVALAGQRVRGVRFRDGSFEMRCGVCAQRSGLTAYWPVTTEFWEPRNLSACRACLLERKRRDAKARYWADPVTHRKLARDYYAKHAEVVKLKQRARHASNPTARRDAMREWERAHRDELRAYRRAYYARNREHILLREKLRRAGVLPKGERLAA